MKSLHLSRAAAGALAALFGVAGVSHAANAAILFSSGNTQYNNVNIAADIDASIITGTINSTPYTMTFNSMLGSFPTQPAILMHGQHGVAFVESAADAVPGATHTGFSSITLTAQAGTFWSAGDFALDELVDNPSLTEQVFVTFSGLNFSPPVGLADVFDIHGQSQYNFSTTAGEQITSITIAAASNSGLMQDIKQVSLDVSAVPEPSTWAMFLVGFGAIGFMMRGSNRKKSGAVA